MREEIRSAFSQLDTDRPLSEVIYELDLFLAMMKEAREHTVTNYGIPVRLCALVIATCAADVAT